jgi:hypothetical protein
VNCLVRCILINTSRSPKLQREDLMMMRKRLKNYLQQLQFSVVEAEIQRHRKIMVTTVMVLVMMKMRAGKQIQGNRLLNEKNFL